MEVRRDRAKRTLELRQTAYIDCMLEKFGMGDCRPVATPADAGLELQGSVGATFVPTRST
eukprot:53296-Eustigmatos_ZCMA.PRE.1